MEYASASRIPPTRTRPRPGAGARATLVLLVLIPCLLPAATAPGVTPPTSTPPAGTGTVSNEATAVMAAVAEGFAALAAIEDQAKTAPGGQQALDLQARIAQTKRDLQKRVLEIQLDYARRDGRLDKAAGIESALARMANPPAGEPQSRPAPPTAPAAR